METKEEKQHCSCNNLQHGSIIYRNEDGNCVGCGRNVTGGENMWEEKQRSLNLNSAYWCWLTEVARDLENNGHTMQDVVKKMHTLEVRPTKDALHYILSKPYLEAQFQKDSSAKCTNQELQQLIDALTLFFAHNFDSTIPFSPDMHNLIKHYDR